MDELVNKFVSNLFEHRVISYQELLDYRAGEDCPLTEACVEAFKATIKEKE